MDDPKWTMRGLGNDLNFIIITEHKLTTMTLCSVVETVAEGSQKIRYGGIDKRYEIERETL